MPLNLNGTYPSTNNQIAQVGPSATVTIGTATQAFLFAVRVRVQQTSAPITSLWLFENGAPVSAFNVCGGGFTSGPQGQGAYIRFTPGQDIVCARGNSQDYYTSYAPIVRANTAGTNTYTIRAVTSSSVTFSESSIAFVPLG